MLWFRMLTSQQIETYRRDGYLVIPRLIDDAIGEGAQFSEPLALDQARDHQIAVPAIGLDLLIAEHAKP